MIVNALHYQFLVAQRMFKSMALDLVRGQQWPLLAAGQTSGQSADRADGARRRLSPRGVAVTSLDIGIARLRIVAGRMRVAAARAYRVWDRFTIWLKSVLPQGWDERRRKVRDSQRNLAPGAYSLQARRGDKSGAINTVVRGQSQIVEVILAAE